MSTVHMRIVLLAIALLCNSALAADPSPFGVFSSLHLVPGERDVVGIEVFVVDTADGCYVHFQSAEGEPRKPKLVKCEVSGDILTFTLPSDPNDYRGRFRGRIGRKGITGGFDSGQVGPNLKTEFFLPRKLSFWQRKGG